MRAPVILSTTTTTTTTVIITSLLLSLISSVTAQFSCSAVGYFPHPSDCSQFYRCTDIWSTGQYQQFEFQCAEGTVFDVSIREVSRLTKQLRTYFLFFIPNCHLKHGGAATSLSVSATGQTRSLAAEARSPQ